MINTPYRAALVTGAGRRIGRAIACGLANQGFSVAVHYHGSAEAANAVVAEIIETGGKAKAITADLRVEKEVLSLIDNAATLLGLPIDILVNNASVFENDTLQTLTAESWDKHQKVNLLAPVLLMQKLANGLVKGEPGAIINIIDQRVLKLNPQFMSYTASKAALWTATKTAAQSLAPSVRVNAIAPGPTLANSKQSAQEFADEAAAVLLGRGPALEEIAQAVRFILQTPSMTGQMIALDGGQHLAWRTADIPKD